MKYDDFRKKMKLDGEDDAPDLPFDISEMIIDARVYQGVSQKKLAKMVGTKQPSIARLENGNGLPSLSFLQKVANALGFRVEVRLKKL